MQTSALRSDYQKLRSIFQPQKPNISSPILPGSDPAHPLKLRRGKAVQRHHRTWSNAVGTVDDIQFDGEIGFEVNSPRPLLVMCLEEVGGQLRLQTVGGEAVHERIKSRTGAVSLLPPGVTACSVNTGATYFRIFMIEFEETFWKQVGRTGSSNDPCDAVRFIFDDPVTSKLCRLIAQECISPDCFGREYADGLIVALTIALARSQQTRKSASRGGLAPWQLRKVQTHMLEHLAEGVSLRELADMTEVSLTHFSRAFKASVGCAPHQWMIEARMAEAKKQLMDRNMSLAAIATELGFCDQAHFTRIFTKSAGSTPMAWQKSHTN